ncbi:MAG TPA: nucleotidyltransferase domain-containing protein [Thermomicrobiales bacterium]
MAQVVHKVSMAVMHERVHAAPEQIAAFCRAHHIRWLALFGSVLRDDFRDDSDIDVLVEFDPEHPVTFFDLRTMEEELSRLFRGRTVDLVTRAALYWRMRDRILRSMVVLYGDAPAIPDAVVPEVFTAKDNRVYIGIMWDMARTMHDAVCGKGRADYDADEILRYGLAGSLRRFSARSAQVSQMFRESHTEIAWEKTAAIYRSVSEDGISINEGMLWEIVTGEIPALIPMLEQMLPPGMRYPPGESGNG